MASRWKEADRFSDSRKDNRRVPPRGTTKVQDKAALDHHCEREVVSVQTPKNETEEILRRNAFGGFIYLLKSSDFRKSSASKNAVKDYGTPPPLCPKTVTPLPRPLMTRLMRSSLGSPKRLPASAPNFAPLEHRQSSCCPSPVRPTVIYRPGKSRTMLGPSNKLRKYPSVAICLSVQWRVTDPP